MHIGESLLYTYGFTAKNGIVKEAYFLACFHTIYLMSSVVRCDRQALFSLGGTIHCGVLVQTNGIFYFPSGILLFLILNSTVEPNNTTTNLYFGLTQSRR